jgi:aspartate/methionine/tyrosine aminotransferase/chorismate mutase
MRHDIETLRKEIRKVDRHIIQLVAKRFQLVERVKEVKRTRGLPIINLRVEKNVINRAIEQGAELDINAAFSKKLINLLIQEAIRIEGETSKDRAAYLYEVTEKVKELKAKGEVIIQLDVGEPDFPTAPQVKKAAITALQKVKPIEYNTSQGLPELRKAIAQTLSHKYAVDLCDEQVLITPGGQFAVFASFLTKIAIGDRVVIPEPMWPAYDDCSRLIGGKTDFIHTLFEHDWRINMKRLQEALEVKPKLLILGNPSNPTGKIISKRDFQAVCQLAEEKEVCVLSDETYSAYALKPSTSILEIADSNYIYVNSFSMKHGMAGWCIGYVVSDLKTITKMKKLIQISITGVSEFIQKAALEALTMKQEEYEAYSREMNERIRLACNELDQYPVPYARPEGGMYIFPKTNIVGFDSRKFAQQLLSKKKVAVVPGEAFGKYPEHFRISLGTNKRALREGVTRIGELVEEWT